MTLEDVYLCVLIHGQRFVYDIETSLTTMEHVFEEIDVVRIEFD